MNSKPYINGNQLYIGISEGIKNLLEYQDKLDEINVFPVPDGDTGTNMCFTLIYLFLEKKASNLKKEYFRSFIFLNH